MVSLLHTLLELGNATSQNLAFAHLPNVNVSYGEETITETNLLEIRRRHPDRVALQTFSKVKESGTTGADWEWHIIGQVFTLKMRVQAKRIHKAGGIGNLHQMAKGAAKPQIDLLIEDAVTNGLLPIYCFYCSEPQRSYWKKGVDEDGLHAFETGCLLADAEVVKSKMPTKLAGIEKESVPWHFLCTRGSGAWRRGAYIQRFQEDLPTERTIEELALSPDDRGDFHALPTVFELNRDSSRLLDRRGVVLTGDVRTDFTPDDFLRRGISRLIKIDVRRPDLFAVRS